MDEKDDISFLFCKDIAKKGWHVLWAFSLSEQKKKYQKEADVLVSVFSLQEDKMDTE